jgi:membrane-bound serine protease (ClpP class)
MLKNKIMFVRTIVSIFFAFFLCTTAFSEEIKKEIMVITVNGVINPVSAEFIGKNIKSANEKDIEALVVELDTPGGLDTSMRNIVKDIVASGVPIIVYVYPSGSRDASAGVFITMAAHIAAMAPGTNIGAAHPVSLQGKMDKTMVEKVTNDAAAYIRSLAEARGRNAKWAVDAVRKSVSITEEEALRQHVIDLVAKDLNSLLAKIDGKKVQTALGERILHTKDVAVMRQEMGLRQKILDLISNPNVAYILMLLGFYGLFFELTNPGSLFPGIIGGICLILAFYAFQTLPVNYAGLLLIILAIILFILEIKIVSHGILAIGGVIAMVIGSLMLFESPGPFMRLSLYVILPAVIVTTLFFVITIRLALKAYRRKPGTGAEGLMGLEGIADTDITEDGGTALLHGERWAAVSAKHISKGENVVVVSVSGLKVKVEKAGGG